MSAIVTPVDHGLFPATPAFSEISSNLKSSFIQKELVLPHIGGQVNVGQVVIIDIPYSNTTAIIKIAILEDVEVLLVFNGVDEVDSCFLPKKALKTFFQMYHARFPLNLFFQYRKRR